MRRLLTGWMDSRDVGLAVGGLMCLLLTIPAARGAETGEGFFEASIRPLLVERCEKCHGEKKQESGLRLDSKAGWSHGGDNGPAIVSGDAAKSLVRGRQSLAMGQASNRIS